MHVTIHRPTPTRAPRRAARNAAMAARLAGRPAVAGEGGRSPAERSPVVLNAGRFRCGRTVWLQLRGVLSWRTADQFRRDVEAGLVRPCRRLVMDLTGIEYIGGDVLRALVGWAEHLTTRGIELRLVVSRGSRCARTMALGGLEAVIPIFTCPAAAWRHRP
jgi:anti-anti-sigma factor